jgi:precorrin-6A/cobalt-precorrin-6A reductase
MSAPEPPHLLILGGTGEAAALAAAALARFADRLVVTTSLAGRTPHPAPLPGRLRTGGFGGSAGMTAYLVAARIALVVDATHPFAARISAEAQEACAAARVPLLTLDRPTWQRHLEDRWIAVADLAEAATRLPHLGRRVFVSTGARELEAFAGLDEHFFLVRLIAPPVAPLPLRSYRLLLGRGPFDLDSERRILDENVIDALVVKASGGAATEAKLVAARERRLPVLMVQRPPKPARECVDSVAAAIAWIAARLAPVAPSVGEEVEP